MATCAISTLIQQACANDFVTAANDVQLYRAIKHQLLCNISANGGGGGGAVWGAITGTLSNQADLVAALAAAGNGGAKVYRALLSQAGGAAPTEDAVLQNTIGSIVWTRDNLGVYDGTLAGAFPALKTLAFISTNAPSVLISVSNFNAPNFVRIATTLLDGSGFDGILNKTPIEILVYP